MNGLKPLNAWRFTDAKPYGMMMWFDPSIEQPLLRSLADDELPKESLTDDPLGSIFSASGFDHTAKAESQ